MATGYEKPSRGVLGLLEDTRTISWFGILVVVGTTLIVGAVLMNLVGWFGPNVWWYFMTVLIGYLAVEGSSVPYNKWKKGHKSEIWIPLEFVVFILVIFAGSVVGGSVSQTSVQAFDKPGTLAWVMFLALNFILPFVLLYDFYKRGKFERTEEPVL